MIVISISKRFQKIIFDKSIHNLCRLLSIILLFILLNVSCQPTDTYEVRYNKCFENVKTIEFDVEGATKKGFGYTGFDPKCLVGSLLPFFKGTDINGDEIETKNLIGKATVINFWFIKCAPCIAEIPDLNSIVNKYGKEKVNYVSFSRDSENDIKEFLKSNTFLFSNIPDAKLIIEENFRLIWGYPSTIVVNREGRIVEIFQGSKLKNDPSISVTTAIDSLLAELLRK